MVYSPVKCPEGSKYKPRLFLYELVSTFLPNSPFQPHWSPWLSPRPPGLTAASGPWHAPFSPSTQSPESSGSAYTNLNSVFSGTDPGGDPGGPLCSPCPNCSLHILPYLKPLLKAFIFLCSTYFYYLTSEIVSLSYLPFSSQEDKLQEGSDYGFIGSCTPGPVLALGGPPFY